MIHLYLSIDKGKLNTIGIDKVTFTIDAAGIDLSSILEESEELKTRFINYSKVDEQSEKTLFKFYNQHEHNKQVLKLDIVASRIYHDTEHNIYPAPIENLNDIVWYVLHCIFLEKNIWIPIDSLKLVYMEINNTVEISSSLKRYADSIFYMFGNRYKYIDKRDNNNSCTIVTSTEKCRKILKFYDKAAQVANDLEIESSIPLARFEITLKQGDNIKKIFHTQNFMDIKQADIEKFYNKELKQLEKQLKENIMADAAKFYNHLKTNNIPTGFIPLGREYTVFNDSKKSELEIDIPFFEVLYIAAANHYKDNNKTNVMRDVKKVMGAGSTQGLSPKMVNLELLLKLLSDLSSYDSERKKEKKVKSQLYQVLHTNLR